MKLLASVLLSILMTACATTGEGFYSEEEITNGAIIKSGSHREGVFTWSSFSLYSVNGDRVPYGFNSAPSHTKLRSGKSKIVVLASFNNGMGAPFTAKVPMEVELNADTTYAIDGKVSGTNVEIWLALASSKEKIGSYFYSTARRTDPGPTVTVIRLPAR